MYALFNYSNKISQPPELYLQYIMSVKGKFKIEKDSIIFSCDSLYGLNCCYSSNNNSDETLFKYIHVYFEATIPIIPNLYFCNNNDTIAEIVNISDKFYFNDSVLIKKNKYINNIIKDWAVDSERPENINITNLSDTIFIFEENYYYDIFNKKKFKLHTEERLTYILIDNIRVYITFREPPKEVIDKDRYSKLFEKKCQIR